MSEEWGSLLSDTSIRRAVGDETYRRGEAYFHEGRVSALKINPPHRTLFATVSGNRPTGYQTIVKAGAGASPTWAGRCTCPMAVNCKHVAAVLMAARERVGMEQLDLAGGGIEWLAASTDGRLAAWADARLVAKAHGTMPASVAAPSWESRLSSVIRRAAADRSYARTPLALQFEVVSPPHPSATGYRGMLNAPTASSPRPAPRVRLRPLVLGRKGSWIRTGAAWRDIAANYPGPEDPAQRGALRELYAAYQLRPGNHYSYGTETVHLDELGPSLWRLLQLAVEAGVALVNENPLGGPIALAPEPARVRLDLRRDHEDGPATLSSIVEVGDRTVSAVSVDFVGTPIHGLVLRGDSQESAELLLARLDKVPGEAASELLREGRPLAIPAGDLARFLRDYYPALRHAIDVVSSDESVVLPEIAPPLLSLTVTYQTDQKTSIHWEFAYFVGNDVQRLPLRVPTSPGISYATAGSTGTTGSPGTTGAISSQGMGGLRDVPAEDRLLKRLDLPDDRLPHLRAMVSGQLLLIPDVTLTGPDAAYFTHDLLPQLQELDDLVVQVEGTAPDYRFSDVAPLVHLSTTETPGDRDWFQLGVRVSIDGEEIPFQPLFVALARGDTHLVLESGTWFSIERPELDQLRRLIEEARSLQDKESDGLRISAYQAGLWEELMELGVVQSQSSRWATTVKGLLEIDDLPAPPVPDSILADLRPYQVDGYQWLSFLWDHGLGGILADDMGLGKTVQTLAMICRVKEADERRVELGVEWGGDGEGELGDELPGRHTGPFLVVAPTSVVPNWSHEAARFAPHLTVVRITESEARSGQPLAERAQGADIVVTSYALFRLGYDAYAGVAWSGLILDEAQFVKNHQSKTYQCARRLPAPFKLAITGTPLENSLMDLWSMLSIVAPGLFPSPQRFSELYRKPIEAGGAPELLATLRRRIRPLMRRRTKEQVAGDLPPKVEQILEVALNPRHQKIYQMHLQRERQKVLGLIDNMDKNRFAIFRSLTLLRQLSLDPALVDPKYAGVRSSKADAFMEQLEEVVSEGHRALVFSQFTGFLKIIRDRLDAEGIDYCYLDGRTRHRAKRIDEFKNGSAPVFLISLKAGGFGLNLTEADYCFVLDPWWNPAAEAQAVDRAHRIGQHRTVMVYRLVATDTIEEKVMELKARKSDLFARVMDEDALLSAPLSANDIRGLLA